MEETQHILQMLEEGKITAQEASRLLEAIEPRGETHAAAQEAGTLALAGSASASPEMQRFRRLSQIPFAIALTVLILSGWGTYALCSRTEGRITLGFVVVLIVLILAVLSTIVTFWMTQVPWLHVRIQQRQGRRIAFSFPLPLTLANWGLRIAYRFVDQNTVPHLDTAAELVKGMRGSLRTSGGEPIVVDVDDADDRVQVYIG
jgi:hypothetical protein